MQNVHNCDMQINEPKDLQFFNEIRIINTNVCSIWDSGEC